jgi:hypothetical protein
MAATSVPFDPARTTAQFYAVLKSVSEFDKFEVSGLIHTLLATSDREQCFIATYLRASAIVKRKREKIRLKDCDIYPLGANRKRGVWRAPRPVEFAEFEPFGSEIPRGL